jgi:hypothetical protein
MSSASGAVLAYHDRTKHDVDRFARGQANRLSRENVPWAAIFVAGRVRRGNIDAPRSVHGAARPRSFSFAALSFAPTVDLALFVHRVDDLEPGLYLYLREPGELASDYARRLPSSANDERGEDR